MKKVVIISKVIAIFCTVILLVTLIGNVKNNIGTKNVENETNEIASNEITEHDIKKLETQIDVLQKYKKKLIKEMQVYEQWSKGFTEKEIEEFIQSEIIKCYEENILLALEAKTLVMGSFDVQVPTGFSNGEAVMEEYGAYISNTVLNGILNEVATEPVKDVLKNGIDGAIDAYKEQGTLENVMEGAISSIADGVIAEIQDEAKEKVMDILDSTTNGLGSIVIGMAQSNSIGEFLQELADEKTGGLIGSLVGITEYDTTPNTLLQNVSNSASDSSKEVKKFLDKENMTSKDIGEMMYQYAQFGNAMDTLRYYGGTTFFNWKNNYEKMEIVYERFLRNEFMIEMLSTEGVDG